MKLTLAPFIKAPSLGIMFGMEEPKSPEEKQEEINEENAEKVALQTIDGFCSYLYKVYMLVKFYHLNSNSYAIHKHLQGLYDELDELIDTLVESSQNESKMKLEIEEIEMETDVLSFLREAMQKVCDNRNVFPLTHQQSQIDLIVTSLSQTIYKVTFLN